MLMNSTTALADRVSPAGAAPLLHSRSRPGRCTAAGAGVCQLWCKASSRAGITVRRGRGCLQICAAIKKTSQKNVVCTKVLIALKGSEKEAEARCQGLVTFAKSRMADRSSGILAFECSKDRYDDNVFHFWERYDSNKSLGIFNSSPEVNAFMEEVQQYLEGPVGMALYEWKDGQISNVCIQGGPKGEGGLDDATGAGGMSAGAGLKQTSGTLDLGNVERNDGEEAWGMNFKFPWQKEKAAKN